ncbi:MAG TPA: protein adenylyltransferase SelO family protein, partial [Gallionellaceae bacterium]
SILGLTFDYGPFGFMEAYNPGHVCNHSDHGGRYAFDQQPQIGLWNLTALAQALSPLVPLEEAEQILDEYGDVYSEHYVQLMCRKLGLTYQGLEEFALIQPLLELMQQSGVDYTKLFRQLGQFRAAEGEANTALRDQFIDRAAFDRWAAAYRARLQQESSTDAERKVQMDRANPRYILRNYLAQTAIGRAESERDYSEVDRLLQLLARPYDEQPGMEAYARPAPDWARNLEVSCSS